MLETSLVNETSLLCITVLSLALKKKSLGVGTEFYLGLEPNFGAVLRLLFYLGLEPNFGAVLRLLFFYEKTAAQESFHKIVNKFAVKF